MSNWIFSNFTPCSIKMSGVIYPTVEHAYCASRTLDPKEREQIRQCKTPGLAKIMSRKMTQRPDWHDVNLNIMRAMLREKFKQEPYRTQLRTFIGPIVEVVQWHDRFWGVCNCTTSTHTKYRRNPSCHGGGKNVLGTMLMEVQAEL